MVIKDRSAELDDYIRGYRLERMDARKEYIGNNYAKLLPELFIRLDELTGQLEALQEEGYGKAGNLVFFRLLSSGYTGSNEIAIGMGNAWLYLDDRMPCVYWEPELIHDSIGQDMEEVRRMLNRKFTRIEEYELLCLKQGLLRDDWNLFCGILGKLADPIGRELARSSLLEEEIQMLYGDYMDRLEAACKIKTGREK